MSDFTEEGEASWVDHQAEVDHDAGIRAEQRRKRGPFHPYIEFIEEEIPETRKTKIIGIYTTSSHKKLGEIRWWSPWRQYTFFPAHTTVWNVDCMNSIIAKIDEMMKERK